MKVAIVGNGSLGLFTAARFAQSSNISSLTIYGDSNRYHSASCAAGLMLNIISEVDAISCHMPLVNWKVSNWRLATSAWDSCFGEKGFISSWNPYTSYGTKIQLSPSSTNSLERLSFEVLASTAEAVQAIDQNHPDDIVYLPYEHSVDSRCVIALLDQYLADHAILINAPVSHIQSYRSGYNVYVSDSEPPVYYDKIVLAAGSFTDNIIANSSLGFVPKVKCLYGVGSALEIFSEYGYLPNLSTKTIFRTPNRGGTCGLHLVQRSNSLYVGASSFVTHEPSKFPRFSSIQSLINGVSDELPVGDCLRHSITTITGYRPVTQDAVPVMGPVSDNLFLMYGHKRDGFTWAPYLATIASDWLNGREYPEVACQYLQMTNPTRDLTPFADHKTSLKLYLLNEQFSRHQHGEAFSDSDRSMLIKRFNQLHSDGPYTLSPSHPELVNVNSVLSGFYP